MNYSQIYTVNWKNLVNFLTPPFLRTVRLIDWLLVLIEPLSSTNRELRVFRDQAIYKVTHNGTVVLLQKVLNDAFDNELRRILICDTIEFPSVWVYPEADNRPVYVDDESGDPVWVYDFNSVFTEAEYDFIVKMPIELMPTGDTTGTVDEVPEDLLIFELQIKSLVNYYKLASKRYKIVWM